jgi:hypothetical protein
MPCAGIMMIRRVPYNSGLRHTSAGFDLQNMNIRQFFDNLSVCNGHGYLSD